MCVFCFNQSCLQMRVPRLGSARQHQDMNVRALASNTTMRVNAWFRAQTKLTSACFQVSTRLEVWMLTTTKELVKWSLQSIEALSHWPGHRIKAKLPFELQCLTNRPHCRAFTLKSQCLSPEITGKMSSCWSSCLPS